MSYNNYRDSQIYQKSQANQINKELSAKFSHKKEDHNQQHNNENSGNSTRPLSTNSTYHDEVTLRTPPVSTRPVIVNPSTTTTTTTRISSNIYDNCFEPVKPDYNPTIIPVLPNQQQYTHVLHALSPQHHAFNTSDGSLVDRNSNSPAHSKTPDSIETDEGLDMVPGLDDGGSGYGGYHNTSNVKLLDNVEIVPSDNDDDLDDHSGDDIDFPMVNQQLQQHRHQFNHASLNQKVQQQPPHQEQAQAQPQQLQQQQQITTSPPPPQSIFQQRFKVYLNSILSSERAYIERLSNLISFYSYLKRNLVHGLTQSDLNVLFQHIEEIYEKHVNFNSNLKKLFDSIQDYGNYQNEKYLFVGCLDMFYEMIRICLKLYLEFLNNYPKAMTILNKFEQERNDYLQMQHTKAGSKLYRTAVKQPKSTQQQPQQPQFDRRKSFIECERDFNQQIFSFSHQFDTAQIFSEDILKRPLRLIEYLMSLKNECSLFLQNLDNGVDTSEFQTKMKLLFESNEIKTLKEDIFEKIDRNVLPTKIRKNADVVELCEVNDRKLRHLVLYGDCLVCCRIKKDKKQLKWFIPIDRIDIRVGDDMSKKSENDVKQLRDEVASLSGNLKRQQQNESDLNQQTKRSTVRLKKKLEEQQAELQLKSSCLELIIVNNHRAATINSSSNLLQLAGGLGSSSTNLTSASPSSTTSNNLLNLSMSSITSSSPDARANHASKDETFRFLFTSDFERIEWMEQVNGAKYAHKSRKTQNSVTASEIEGRINQLQKSEEPSNKPTEISTCTGTLELLIKHVDGLSQTSKVFVAVEVKSFGSYLQVANTRVTDLTTKPTWEEKFNLELQCVDQIRVILYCQTSAKPLAIGSQELTIDPKSINSTKAMSITLNNNCNLIVTMKFLSPKKTITRRRTRNKNDLFGNNLSEVLQKEKSSIPRILIDCVEVIETKGIEEVGIYRVSAVVSEVQRMKELFGKNPKQAQAELRQKSPHLAANVLKLYLRELPEPLFTSDLYPAFISSIELKEDARDETLCKLFNELIPEPNKSILMFILNHLSNIANNSEKNMMNMQNLATLFGPTLMKLSPKDKLDMDDMAKEIRESLQQASVLFYILKLHSNERLLNYTNINKDLNNNLNKQLTNMSINTNQQSATPPPPPLPTPQSSSQQSDNKQQKSDNGNQKFNMQTAL